MAKRVTQPGLLFLSALVAPEVIYAHNHEETPYQYLEGQRPMQEREGKLRLNREHAIAVAVKAMKRKRRQEQHWESDAEFSNPELLRLYIPEI
jgi:hypothetical protein